jgi:hypothetical protein
MIGKRITVLVLGIITFLELVITKQMGDSCWLWFMYGIYKLVIS